MRVGRILSVDPESALHTDCTLIGGDSGGPLFDMEGSVIGVHSRIGGSLTMNLHVPVAAYHDSWERLVAGDDFDSTRIEVPFLGVVPEEESDEVLIGHVYEDSGAAKAGISEGDVIVLLGRTREELEGSEYLWLHHGLVKGTPPWIDLGVESQLQQVCLQVIREGIA